MNKEREYLEHKGKTLIDLVNIYNSWHSEEGQFKIDVENLNIKESFCSYCKGCGRCCGNGPCIYSPRDFLDITDLDYMRKILNTGVVAIIEYNNYQKTLIIRNRGVFDADSVASKDVDYDLAHNPCLLVGKNGCLLPDVYRASQGLLYVAEKSGWHESLYDEESVVAEYCQARYQKILRILYDEYKDVIIPKSSNDYICDQRTKFIAIPKEPISEESVNQFIRCLINKK